MASTKSLQRAVLTLSLIAAGCTTAPPKPDPRSVEVLPEPKAQTPEMPERPLVEVKKPEEKKAEEPKKDEGPRPLDSGVRDDFEKGMQAAISGDPDKALKAFKDAASADPRTYWAHYNLGLLYDRKEDFANAEKSYLTALDLKPEADRAAENYAKLCVRNGKAPKAEHELRQRVEKSPGASGLRNALAWTLLEEGQLEAAATEAKKVLKVDEQNARSMFVLAKVYFKQQKTELAMMVLENAAAIDRERPEIPNMQGLILLAQKKPKAQALEKFRAAAAMREDFPEAHNNLGSLLLASQNWPEAIKELELTVKYAPKMAAAHVNLGNAYRGAGDFDRAKKEYDAGFALDPKLGGDVYFNLAVLYMDSEVKGDDIDQHMLEDRMKQALAFFKNVRDAGRADENVTQYEKDANKTLEKINRGRERKVKDKLRAQKKAEDDAKKAIEDAKKQAEELEKKKAEDEKNKALAEKKSAEEKAKADKLAAIEKAKSDKLAAAEAAKAAAEQARLEKLGAVERARAEKKAADDKAKADKLAAAEAAKAAAEQVRLDKMGAAERVRAEKKAAEDRAKAEQLAEKKAADDAKKAADDAKKAEAARLAEEKKKKATVVPAKGTTGPVVKSAGGKLGDDDDAPAPPKPPAKPAGKIGDD